MNKVRIFFYLILAIALLSMTAGFISYSKTLAVVDDQDLSWDVSLYSYEKKNDDNFDVTLDGNRVDVTFRLELDKTYAFKTIIQNKGSYNASLNNINYILTQEVGESKTTGNVYTLSDYVSVKAKYNKKNLANDIHNAISMKNGDLLLKHSENIIEITIKTKNSDDLTWDQIDVFNNLSNDTFLASIIFDYQQI